MWTDEEGVLYTDRDQEKEWAEQILEVIETGATRKSALFRDGTALHPLSFVADTSHLHASRLNWPLPFWWAENGSIALYATEVSQILLVRFFLACPCAVSLNARDCTWW